MATVPAQIAPEVAPRGGTDAAFQNIRASTPDLGPGIGQGLVALGQGAVQAGDFFGQVVADDAANQYQESVQKILTGDPEKMIQGPDGKMVQDTGYLGLKGRAALDARPAIERKIDELRKQLSDGLKTPKSQLQFDNFSRRFKAITDAQVGTHARTQGNVYASQVNSVQAKMALDDIAANADNPDRMSEAVDRLTQARVKQAQLEGGAPEVVDYAVKSALRDGLTAQLNAIAVNDPARALRILEKNREVAGAQYDNLYNSFRSRADVQTGTAYADNVVGPLLPLEAGNDTKAMLRHFEGFREGAYWDVNHHRVGYGSDTVTRMDGRVEKTTKDTRVSREEAEKDLERRAAMSQAQLRAAVGEEVWKQLDPRIQASLTSVTYNYGRVPDTVAAATKTLDANNIAKAIRDLGSDNRGINRNRRNQEAANVLGERPPMPSQAEALDRIENSDLSPQAKSAAAAQVNRRFTALRNSQVKEKAAFDSAVADSTAEAMQTGGTTNPVPEETFIRQLGESAGRVAYREYQADLDFAAQRKNFDDMPDQEIQMAIDRQIPAPGMAGYAHRMKNVERLRKYADALAVQRRDDPAGVVDRMQAVKDVKATYVPNRPETFKAVAQARLAAQEMLGIEEENRSPITKAEALALTKPLKLMLPGEEHKAIVQTYQQFEKMFGTEMAPDAFRYAVKAAKVASEGQAAAATVMQKIAKGLPLTRDEVRSVDDAAEKAAIEKVIRGTAPLGGVSPGLFDMEFTPGGSTVTPDPTDPGSALRPKIVPPRAMSELLRHRSNPDVLKEFNEKYGRGRAEEILKKFPAPGGGG